MAAAHSNQNCVVAKAQQCEKTRAVRPCKTTRRILLSRRFSG